jgi:hypothetical protein
LLVGKLKSTPRLALNNEWEGGFQPQPNSCYFIY